MLLCPLSRTMRATPAEVLTRLILRLRQLDQHGKVDARNDLDILLAQKGRSDVGRCAAEHVRQDQDAVIGPNSIEGVANHRRCGIDVVVPPDRDRRHSVNLANNHFSRVQ